MTDRLKDSKTFCMMPWLHMHAFADGRVYPCCFGDYHTPMGNLRENTMEEVWNNDSYKQLRKNMLNEKLSAVCKKCYEQESNGIFSLRNSINQSHGKYVDEVEKTLEDGTHPEFKLRYWDVRFSNLCNFSCRSCSPVFSSNWYKEHVKMYGGKPKADDGRELNVIEYAGRNKYDILEQMEPHFEYLDQIYFAGGEPLMIKEHKMFIEEIIRQGYQDKILLRYNSNGLLVDDDLIELWSKFKKVKFAISMDASHERDEYIRYPTNFETVEKTLHLLDNTPDNIQTSLATAIQIFNIKH